MIPYRIQEADFQIPPEWTDQSINVFKLPETDEAGEASIVVTRDASSPDLPFAEYVHNQIDAAKKNLPSFRLKSVEEPLEINGLPAAAMEFTWKRDTRVLHLRQIFVKQANAILILTLTTTPEDIEHHRLSWDAMLETFVPIPG